MIVVVLVVTSFKSLNLTKEVFGQFNSHPHSSSPFPPNSTITIRTTLQRTATIVIILWQYFIETLSRCAAVVYDQIPPHRLRSSVSVSIECVVVPRVRRRRVAPPFAVCSGSTQRRAAHQSVRGLCEGRARRSTLLWAERL